MQFSRSAESTLNKLNKLIVNIDHFSEYNLFAKYQIIKWLIDEKHRSKLIKDKKYSH